MILDMMFSYVGQAGKGETIRNEVSQYLTFLASLQLSFISILKFFSFCHFSLTPIAHNNEPFVALLVSGLESRQILE